jgi:hypothetical protein
MMASNERVDSKLWSKQSRANVLVVCPWRDVHVTNEIHARMDVLSQANITVLLDNFPRNTTAGFLHPALVHGFVEVNYNVASKQYRLDHPSETGKGCKAGLWANVQESKMQTLTATFALCDFYKAHINRQSHVYGGLAEMWTANFYDLTLPIEPNSIEQLSIQCKQRLASHLVPINRLAGKFLPGLHPQTAVQKRTRVPQEMLVLRVPIRL